MTPKFLVAHAIAYVARAQHHSMTTQKLLVKQSKLQQNSFWKLKETIIQRKTLF